MSKRLSSLFGLSKDKETGSAGAGNYTNSRPVSAAPSPSASPTSSHRLQKQRLTSTSDLNLNASSIPTLEPPPTFRETASGITPRPSSRPATRNGTLDYASDRESSRSRPQTPVRLQVPGSIAASAPSSPASPAGQGKLSKKKATLPGGRLDKTRFDDGESHQRAWIAGLKEHIPYDLTPLLTGDKVTELWDIEGDVVVHLYPESTGRGPQFRVHSAYFAESRSYAYLDKPSIDQSFAAIRLNELDFEPLPQPGYNSNQTTSIPQIIPPIDNPTVVYLPLELEGDYSAPYATAQGDDLELLILYRNFFSFLTGGALVSTPRQVSLFSIFMGIASILRRLQYSSEDRSTLGEVANTSFARYCDELRLADVRASREKTIEAVVLGENMRYWKLYNEGFVHLAGRYEDVKSINSPKFAKISPITINRLERASLDVQTRTTTVEHKLIDFEFPSMFAGIANSQTATEAKSVRFKAWRLAFIDFRKFTTAHYKRRYGAWPPKASSKKNNFELSGLNRILVQEMYMDFCDLYDMLANPREMTTRTIDMQPMQDAINDKTETIQYALRVIESEYDRSTPPTLPPIPFDTPLIPSFDQSFKGANMIVSQRGEAKLKANEINELLLGSYNREYIKPSAFVQDFMAYERRLAAGATLEQIIDNRCGQWLFLYAVIQALPMTAVDARDLQFTEGCEYFLFQAPRGGKPWMREDTVTSRSWFNVSSAGQTLSLPTEVLDHQPEGIYRRSHCWLVANQWLEDAGKLPPAELPSENFLGPYSPSRRGSTSLLASATSPQYSPAQSPLLRPMTPADGDGGIGGFSRSSSRTNLQVSLEEVVAPVKAPRPVSQYNPSITFDSILGAGAKTPEKKKKR